MKRKTTSLHSDISATEPNPLRKKNQQAARSKPHDDKTSTSKKMTNPQLSKVAKNKAPKSSALSIQDERLMLRLGYHFQQTDLLKRALTHRSVSHLNYERLEFLGDSLLGVIIAKSLFQRYPKEKEGRLTRMRATLVCQDTLAKIARDLQLSRSLILSVGELKSGGHNRESILADVVEAIIGAIYLDCQQFEQVEQIVLNWFQPYLQDIAPSDRLKDPKSRLQEWLQARKLPLPVYEVVDIQGDAPNQHFTVHCHVEGMSMIVGEGSSRRFAEQSAAAEILQLLEKNA